MTEQLKNHIERIRSLSPKLNEATDQAAAIVDRVEKFLNDECSVGLSASVPFRDETTGEDDVRAAHLLVHERISGKYRIGVAVEVYRTDDHGEFTADVSRTVTAWSSVDRETKLASFEKLPAMLEEIAEKAEKATATVDGAAKSAEAVLKALTASPDHPRTVVTDRLKLKPGEEQVVTDRFGRSV